MTFKIEFMANTDLFTVKADALAQGCNCTGKMGAGIANTFRLKYPNMYKSYTLWCKHNNYSEEALAGTVQMWQDGNQIIFNLFTQYHPGANAKIKYVSSSFSKMFGVAEVLNLASIAIPKVGSGIGGLEWGDVLGAVILAGDESTWKGTLIVAML